MNKARSKQQSVKEKLRSLRRKKQNTSKLKPFEQMDPEE
jgi:hypothetical protein